ncbi:MAG: CHAD domain-containing protein, partial [Anaerolineae bacterium]|nr:CHAD domain-containing protein [Anaerolineae bacterium]
MDGTQALERLDGQEKRKESIPDVRALLLRSLEDRWQTYRAQLERCREEPSEDAVHDLRVAMRRLISTLSALHIILPDSLNRLQKTRRNLSNRLDKLSPLRDTQVQALTIQEMLPAFPILRPYHSYLTRRERRLVKRVGKEVKRTGTAKMERTIAIIGERLRALP